jgi:hypothetical protein
MALDTAPILSARTNLAMVHLPGRRFPGSVIQGDTLHSLVKSVQLIRSLLRQGDAQEAVGELELLEEELNERLGHYEQVLREHGLELPY